MAVSAISDRGRLGVAASGVAFVGLFLAATFFGASELGGPDQPATTIARDLSEHRIDGLRLGAALVGLSAVAGYWFVAGLYRRLSASRASVAPVVVLVGGIGMVTMVLATSASAQAVLVVDSLVQDPQVAKTLWLIEHGSWALMGPPQIAFILGVSVVALTDRDPARWVGVSGVVVAVGLAANMAWGLGSVAGIGLLWVLVLAISLVAHAPERAMAQ